MESPLRLARPLLAEALGTAILVATVVGSGIMAEPLAGGNQAIALLGNTLPTGAILVVLITVLAPVSGAHFNPAVTLVFAVRRKFPWRAVIALHDLTVRGWHSRDRPRASHVRSRSPRGGHNCAEWGGAVAW
jgi:glycerol uptake facilitator-like aquaporin